MARATKLLPLQSDAQVDASVELEPFIECAERALRDRDASSETPSGMSWNEACSMAWLFAYRMADQRFGAAVVSAGLLAWRDAVAMDADVHLKTWVYRAADELISLAMEGYARGVKEREQLEMQRALSEIAPVRELEPGLLLAIAAGPMDTDGAQAFAERVSREILRRDAKVIVLDVGDLQRVNLAVLAELWTIVSAARTLGARAFVSGVSGVVHELLASGGIADEGEVRVALVSEAMKLATELLHPSEPKPTFWKRWFGRSRSSDGRQRSKKS
jgi:anti-anti-sigma regulatory factor